MWRLLLLFSVLPIIAALAARWWFGLRVLAAEGKRVCRCDPEKWAAVLPGSTVPAEAPAAEYGRQLRLAAMAEWKARDPKGANSRENSRRFGMAVPPISGIVAVLAAVVAKIPIMGAFSVVFAATALSCALGLLSMPGEMKAIATAVRKLKESRVFARQDDEDSLVESALAHVWKETLPPILGLLQR